MDELDREFQEFLSKEKRKGIMPFVFWMFVILAVGVGVVLFSYYIPHLLLR